ERENEDRGGAGDRECRPRPEVPPRAPEPERETEREQRQGVGEITVAIAVPAPPVHAGRVQREQGDRREELRPQVCGEAVSATGAANELVGREKQERRIHEEPAIGREEVAREPEQQVLVAAVLGEVERD